MASTPLQIGLRVDQPEGTLRANIQVSCSNESTSQLSTKNTASDGKVIFNLGSTKDFSKGWNVGDIIQVYSLYLGFEQKFSFTIPSAGTNVSIRDASGVDVGSFRGGFGLDGVLILVAVPAAPSLRYSTPQEFLDYFNLKTTEQDAANGIEVMRIIRIGENIEDGIDDDTNTKFDDNSGSYYSPADVEAGESPEYHDARFSHQTDYNLKFIPVNELTTFEIEIRAEGSARVWRDLVFNQIDALDSTTGWGASADGSVSLQSTPSKVSEGDAALNLIKSGSTVAAVTYSKTFSSQFKFTDREINVDYFIADNTDLTATDAIEIRFGNDASNYYSQTYDRSDITSNAYVTLSFRKEDNGVTTTGNPDADTLDYFAIVVTATATSTTIAAGDQRLDDIRLNRRDRIVLDKKTGRVRITDPADYPTIGARHARAIYNFGRSSVPKDINHLAIVETGLHILGATFIRSRTLDKSTASLGFPSDIQWFDMFRRSIIRKYKNQPFLPT